MKNFLKRRKTFISLILRYCSKLKNSKKIKNTKVTGTEIHLLSRSFISYNPTDYVAMFLKENQNLSVELITPSWQDVSMMVSKNQRIPTLSIFTACLDTINLNMLEDLIWSLKNVCLTGSTSIQPVRVYPELWVEMTLKMDHLSFLNIIVHALILNWAE